jgi:glutaredoxin 3
MKLILYHYDACPYCQIVREEIDRLGLQDVEYRDILSEPRFRDELIQMNGQSQVPCLVVDGKPMLESADIVDFLSSKFG